MVFIKEFVPRYWVAAIAKRVYNEPYGCLEMNGTVSVTADERQAEYRLVADGNAHVLRAKAFNKLFQPSHDSQDYFLENRNYGFSSDRKGRTSIYEVRHPEWKIYSLYDFSMQVNFGTLFGEPWSILDKLSPVNVMWVEGSEISIFPHRRLDLQPAGDCKNDGQ